MCVKKKEKGNEGLKTCGLCNTSKACGCGYLLLFVGVSVCATSKRWTL